MSRPVDYIAHIRIARDDVLSDVRLNALRGYRSIWSGRLSSWLNTKRHHGSYPYGVTQDKVDSYRVSIASVCYELALHRLACAYLKRRGLR